MGKSQPTVDKLAYSAKQVAAMTGLSRSTVYELIAAGNLSALRVGRRVLVTAESLDRWFKSLPEHGPS